MHMYRLSHSARLHMSWLSHEKYQLFMWDYGNSNESIQANIFVSIYSNYCLHASDEEHMATHK